MREAERLELIREIEAKRGSRVISYITVDRWGLSAPILLEDVRVLEKHIRECLAAKAKKVDLFLYTSGGLAIAPWALVSLFREFLGARQFSVLIPSRAYSAGTLISLGADEIVMGPAGNLGPIDIQMSLGGGYIGVEDVRAYFKLAEDMGLKGSKDKLHLFSLLAQSTHPIIVGDIYRAWSENERLAMLLLGSRKRPLPEKANREIADFLLRRIGDHGQSIRRTEARKIGISFVKDAEECGVDAALTGLFDAYEELLQLDMPFVGGGLTWSVESEDESGDAPVALIESIDRLDIAHVAQGARFWRTPEAAPSKAPAEGQPSVADFEHRAKLSLQWEQLRSTERLKPR